MLIKTEDLTSKNIINFYAPEPLTAEGVALLFFEGDTLENDLLREIFDMQGVKSCFISENLFSIRYLESADKENIKAIVLACLDDYISGNKFFSKIEDKADLLAKCEALADALIRPTLNRDKGDISLLSLQNDVLEVQFIGHCAGCPYAQNTLQNIIIRTFKRHLPQIKEIKLKE